MRVISEFPSYSVRRRRYDWTSIFDGRIREMEQGLDFDCLPASLVTTIRQAAKRRGVIVDVRSYRRTEDRRPVVAVKALPRKS